MTRDYVNYTRKRERQTRRGLILFLVLVFAALLPGIFFYAHRQDLTMSGLKEKTAEKLAAYFPNLHQQSKTPATKKTLSAEVDSPKPIHFNFYDDLPQAQLDSPEIAASDEEAPKKEAPAPLPIAKKTSAPLPAPQPSPEANQREEAVVQELAHDLSVMKTGDPFEPAILQISVFHSLDAAKRYRAALASAGLRADLVTLKVGKKVIYRLQQGPYHQLESLKLAQKRLNERGISCEIRKLPP